MRSVLLLIIAMVVSACATTQPDAPLTHTDLVGNNIVVIVESENPQNISVYTAESDGTPITKVGKIGYRESDAWAVPPSGNSGVYLLLVPERGGLSSTDGPYLMPLNPSHPGTIIYLTIEDRLPFSDYFVGGTE